MCYYYLQNINISYCHQYWYIMTRLLCTLGCHSELFLPFEPTKCDLMPYEKHAAFKINSNWTGSFLACHLSSYAYCIIFRRRKQVTVWFILGNRATQVGLGEKQHGLGKIYFVMLHKTHNSLT